ncbi:GNAT family N-acetyltransferase [Streptomyces piniterrae]|uniref:GNAT family N-acetyltransferase n=1 Tax=Streptomyces piniterrae TaxID=2571125 RepID=A0A4U0NSL5_9ACTN|nr:GNAT family N-acetyltransferase [Streptomyces piniterrae]TJZ57547.1 GNAT family N-acetyltransferase [Streptomyces piniterrae]
MIELSADQLPALHRWFAAGPPAATALAEHALVSGVGRWWADRAVDPRAIAVACADHLPLPWERMAYVHRVPVSPPRPPLGVTVRRLTPEDAPALAALGPDTAWIHASWGGPAGLAGSGHGWAAFAHGRVLAPACTYFRGSGFEDVACVTAPEYRRRRLAPACVTALCKDIAARGHTPSWTCSRDDRPSRLLAWTAGFRLEHEYVHHFTGRPARRVAGIIG